MKTKLKVLLAGESWATHGVHVRAFASDCSPHWAPPEFVAWKYYQPFWNQLVEWLANK